MKTTDQAFSYLFGDGFATWAIRHWLLPYVLPSALQWETSRELFFRTISQTQIEYHASPISHGTAGKLSAGDRLPWVEDLNNYQTLTQRCWQIHAYGLTSHTLQEWAQASGLAVYSFKWSPTLRHYGFAQEALYLIRPDGHIGLAHVTQDIEVLKQYWQSIGYPDPMESA